MPTVSRGTLGGLIPIRINTRLVTTDNRDGDLVGVYSVNVKAIRNPAGTIIVNNGSPVFDTEGSVVYYWDTSALTEEGDYEVEVEARVNSTDVPVRRDFIKRLVKSGAP